MQIFSHRAGPNDTCNQARKNVHAEASGSKPSRSIARFKSEPSQFVPAVLHNTYFMRPSESSANARYKNDNNRTLHSNAIVMFSNALLSPVYNRNKKTYQHFSFHALKLLFNTNNFKHVCEHWFTKKQETTCRSFAIVQDANILLVVEQTNQ